MRVLLISPWRLDGLVCGDDIITDLLMAHPPEGVGFRHFGDALAAGELSRRHALKAWLASLVMHSRPPAGVRYRWEGLPPLPYRLVGKLLPDRPDLDVQWLGAPAAPFDLVHAYTFPVHLDGALRKLPLVLGNSSGNTDLLEHYYHYPPAQYAPVVARDRALLARLHVDHDLYQAARARLVILPSRYAMRLHAEAGVPEAKLRLVRVGMPAPVLGEAAPDPATCRFTLVGQGFWRKGGKTLLEAFARLHALHPEARLTVVSNVPELADPPPGVEPIPSLPRAEVLGRIYPATDVYVLPTLAEGYGLSVVEAMGHGLPVIASRVGALGELVQDGETGRLVAPESVDELFEAMRALMEDAALRRRMGAAGRAAFLAEHEVGVTNRALAAAYREATA